MSRAVVQVRNLGKKYRIGKMEKRADTFMQTVGNAIKAPFENYRSIRDMVKTDRDEQTIFWALRDVSFDVKEGEVLGVVGHNGAGKSTLLKILSQITMPTEGEAIIRGRVSSLLEVGTGFHQELTGRENIYMNGTILGMTRREIDTRLDEIIDFSGIEKYIDTSVKFYSSGMKVRLGFAVAAHMEPEILIIDEVLAVGDAEFQKRCLGKMEDVSKLGRTILFVSHNLEAIRSLCSRAILLTSGKLDVQGSVHDIINKYISNHKQSTLVRNFDKDAAPGNAEIKLLSATLISSEQKDILTIDSELQFVFKFYAEQAIPDFNLSLVLWTISGTCIFNCVTSVVSIAIGEHFSQLTVPGGLLNNDIYSIELYFVSRSMKIFKVPELLVFELMDSQRNVG